MNKYEMRERITQLEKQYHSIMKALPFADGQAYYQDRNRLNELQNEMTDLANKIWELQKSEL